MDPNAIPDLKEALSAYADDIDQLRQLRLLPEAEFIQFARDRGIPVWGVAKGDPSYLHGQGFLDRDDECAGDNPLFHPFRVYPLQQLLRSVGLQLGASVPLRGKERTLEERTLEVVKLAMQPGVDIQRLRTASLLRNRVADVAILLEPIYWPRIVGRVRHGIDMSDAQNTVLYKAYREKVLQILLDLDQEVWRGIHERLREDAAMLDENSELYLLLRLSDWGQREKLKGTVSGGLWLRHIAELIRLAFEEVYDVRWPEEDEAFGVWPLGARTVAFGSARPLDDTLRSKPYVGFRFGLFTGATVRWYVEGDTEYYAVLEAIPEPARFGIELVNLCGNIKTEKANIALKLADALEEDLRLRRFSMISFDSDVEQNVRTVRRQVEQGRIVGLIAAHSPDFEFANFTLSELVEIAARIDENEEPGSAAALRNGNWEGVTNAGEFEDHYKTISDRRPRSLKNESWGRALARFALECPHRGDNGEERPLLREIRAALQARMAHYDFQKEHFRFDIETLSSSSTSQRKISNILQFVGMRTESQRVVVSSRCLSGAPTWTLS